MPHKITGYWNEFDRIILESKSVYLLKGLTFSNIVGINSVTVGWICTPSLKTVYGCLAYIKLVKPLIISSPPTPRTLAPKKIIQDEDPLTFN